MIAGLAAFAAFCAFGVVSAMVLGHLKRKWDREHPQPHHPFPAE